MNCLLGSWSVDPPDTLGQLGDLINVCVSAQAGPHWAYSAALGLVAVLVLVVMASFVTIVRRPA